MSIIEDLQWRYATKRMTGEKVSPVQLDYILEAIRLSASAFGLQPYNIILVENDDTKQKLYSAAKQRQFLESSHVLVFAAWADITKTRLQEYVNLIAEQRQVSEESLNGFHKMMENSLLALSTEKAQAWCAKQAYIALGSGLIAAASQKVDSTPMEGFPSDQVDEILGLKERGLKSAVALALGFRDAAKDPNSKAKKVRRKKEDLFIKV